ncbi:hypothetical protein MXB_1564 [Myxobolus squamalis]|nr:hypothetical protein MXB_1564 [Myxobolus squamalis]
MYHGMTCAYIIYVLMASDEARDKVTTMMKKCTIFQLENSTGIDSSLDNSGSDIYHKNTKIPSPGRYIKLLNQDNIDIKALRTLSWNGVPDCCRLKTWNILSGILSSSSSNHNENTTQKQKEYQSLIKSYYECRNTISSDGIIRQICIDIPRTYPLLPLFQNPLVQKNNYTPDQPGIQTKIHKIKCLVERFDVSLYMKLLSLSFDETLFCYKWLNNLFVRDFSLKSVIRLWDTMWAQNDGFDVFIVYICGAILKIFSEHIKNITEPFVLFLQFT